MTRALLVPTLLLVLACAGGSAATELRPGVRYYFDRDLQPELGVDFDYALTFGEDGTFVLDDEGDCLGTWEAGPDGTVLLEVTSGADPDGNPKPVSVCWAPGPLKVEGPDRIVAPEGYVFRARE